MLWRENSKLFCCCLTSYYYRDHEAKVERHRGVEVKMCINDNHRLMTICWNSFLTHMIQDLPSREILPIALVPSSLWRPKTCLTPFWQRFSQFIHAASITHSSTPCWVNFWLKEYGIYNKQSVFLWTKRGFISTMMRSGANAKAPGKENSLAAKKKRVNDRRGVSEIKRCVFDSSAQKAKV